MTDDTLLLRQVHPSFIQGGSISEQVFSITSQVFTPTPKDDNLLSVYNNDVFEPDDAYMHYTNDLGLESKGVVAVSYVECTMIDLPVHEDNTPFHGHCTIDFKDVSGKEIKTKAKILKSHAMQRGFLYRP
jgi:hypothetical protein